MTKAEIINRLFLKHNVWKCGWERWQLKALPKRELEKWLRALDESQK